MLRARKKLTTMAAYAASRFLLLFRRYYGMASATACATIADPLNAHVESLIYREFESMVWRHSTIR